MPLGLFCCFTCLEYKGIPCKNLCVLTWPQRYSQTASKEVRVLAHLFFSKMFHFFSGWNNSPCFSVNSCFLVQKLLHFGGGPVYFAHLLFSRTHYKTYHTAAVNKSLTHSVDEDVNMVFFRAQYLEQGNLDLNFSSTRSFCVNLKCQPLPSLYYI